MYIAYMAKKTKEELLELRELKRGAAKAFLEADHPDFQKLKETVPHETEKKKNNGRPREITDEVFRLMMADYALGGNLSSITSAAGFSVGAIFHFRKRYPWADELYLEAREVYKKVQIILYEENLADLRDGDDKRTSAHATFFALERLAPDDYAKRQEVVKQLQPIIISHAPQFEKPSEIDETEPG
jgi:AcrR family transcriptional regulator